MVIEYWIALDLTNILVKDGRHNFLWINASNIKTEKPEREGSVNWCFASLVQLVE